MTRPFPHRYPIEIVCPTPATMEMRMPVGPSTTTAPYLIGSLPNVSLTSI
jgi:hypothetical protein